jgi:hypothetical protein
MKYTPIDMTEDRDKLSLVDFSKLDRLKAENLLKTLERLARELDNGELDDILKGDNRNVFRENNLRNIERLRHRLNDS